MFSSHAYGSRPTGRGQVWTHGLAKDRVVHEITVPTCNYRMGERYMGVGAAVLSKFQNVQVFNFTHFEVH